MDLDEISNWTMLVQALIKLDWKFRFYHHEHPLGIVPCLELTKTTQDTLECRTFYNTQEVWDWVKDVENFEDSLDKVKRVDKILAINHVEGDAKIYMKHRRT